MREESRANRTRGCLQERLGTPQGQRTWGSGDDKSELLGHGEKSRPAASAFVREGFGVIWTTAFKAGVRTEAGLHRCRASRMGQTGSHIPGGQGCGGWWWRRLGIFPGSMVILLSGKDLIVWDGQSLCHSVLPHLLGVVEIKVPGSFSGGAERNVLWNVGIPATQLPWLGAHKLSKPPGRATGVLHLVTQGS